MHRHFIHTSGLSVTSSFKPLITDLYNTTNTSLVSLIDGLASPNSGLNTIAKTARDLRDYKINYLTPTDSKLYIDSSGFHIVKGVVAAYDISKFINCYNWYLESEYEVYDYIFSLDIGSFINDPSASTKENIYNLNKKSISESIAIIKNNMIIKDKFIYVLHFKDLAQYHIFDKLYDELEVYKYSKCFSLGGMVSLNGLTDSPLDFAPFIGGAFWSLYQYKTHSNFEYPFKLHLLGVYWKSFRFCMFFIEELFNNYLEPKNQKAELTYDSVNYLITAMFKAQVGFACQSMSEDNSNLEEYDTIWDIPDRVINQIYRTPESRDIFNRNLELAQINARLENLNYLTNLNVHSQLELDKFFVFIIRKYKLVELMVDSNYNYNSFKNKSNHILNNLPSMYKCLSNQNVKQIQNSLKYIFAFHNWYNNDGTKAKFDVLMEMFIKKINFRYTLS